MRAAETNSVRATIDKFDEFFIVMTKIMSIEEYTLKFVVDLSGSSIMCFFLYLWMWTTLRE